MKQEKKPEPLVTLETPREPIEESRRLRVEELEAWVAPNAIWGD